MSSIGKTSRKQYICSYDGCLEKHYALGLCREHWRRLTSKQEQDNSPWDHLKLYDARNALDACFGVLTSRQKKIISMRYFMDKTYIETAKHFNISSVRVKQIECSAIRKLRQELRKLSSNNILELP